jgi:hypothetical protein
VVVVVAEPGDWASLRVKPLLAGGVDGVRSVVCACGEDAVRGRDLLERDWDDGIERVSVLKKDNEMYEMGRRRRNL